MSERGTMQATAARLGFRWVGAVLPLAVALVGVAALTTLGRTLTESLLVGGALGLASAFLWARRPGPPAAEVDVPGHSKDPDWREHVRKNVDAAQMAELAAHVAELFPDALMLYTDEGKIVYANDAARQLFFEGSDPCGQNFLRILGGAPPALREALLGESDRLFTIEVDRQPETYHLTRRTVELGGGTKILLVLRHLTREISRREVATLKNVVRVISHEVNNSLAPIASMVHSARLIADRPEHAKKLVSVFDTIEERSTHLKTFLDGYAGLARLPAPKPTAVRWAPFFEHVASLYPKLKMPEPPERTGWFDPVQVEQVVINVVKNALEAGSAEDDVELRVAVDADGSARLEVADRGPGFSDEALESAFMPFYTTKEQGSGLGHSLCREIVAAHGGRVSLGNREGGGAIVTVVLPGPAKPDAAVARSRAKLTLSHT
jgi:two-component system nitrogen regulation sensor histidine kinase NtrY